MRPLIKLAVFLWREERTPLLRGLLLSVIVLVAGVALLGLSGWFIAAAAAAGLAGAGITFDVFRPSAGVRFLALGRTAARYGERIMTHDATLRALARLRVQILRHLTRADYSTMVRLRGAALLNRMTADIDALDGLAIHLITPVLAGAVTLALTFTTLWYLVDFYLAVLVAALFALSSWGILVLLGAGTHRASQTAALELLSLREGTVDHLRGRGVLAIAGALDQGLARLVGIDSASRSAQMQVARHEIAAGAALEVVGSLVAAGALAIGGLLVVSGTIDPARAALGFFAALAIFEAAAPLRRGVAELGRMRDAADRIARYAAPLAESMSPHCPDRSDQPLMLELDQVQVTINGRSLLSEPLSFQIRAGQTLALTGKSGAGKSTVLNTIAGLLAPSGGVIRFGGKSIAEMPEPVLRGIIGYLPQRNALLSGTIREALTLGAPANDARLMAVLDAVALSETIAGKGGLDAMLGEGGAGLSGGQRKRLALARVLLRAPKVLLLDEVTEGLDSDTAKAVLAGIRRYLPETTIVMAAHRDLETAFADKLFNLN